MKIFKEESKINFLKIQKITFVISTIIILCSFASIVVKGINFGFDFVGGTQIEMKLKNELTIDGIKNEIKKSNYNNIDVQSIKGAKDVLFTVPLIKNDKDSEEHKKTCNKLIEIFPESEITSISFIGAKVSGDLINKSLIAVMLSLIATFIYIALRFEYRLAISAAIALAHDPIVIIGFFSIWEIRVDLISVAAILTVIGYSLNDTVVVFDRIRENYKKHHELKPNEVINLSINQTLSRTIILSLLTLSVVVSLYIFGGPVLHSFSLALIIGIITGTYSSIYIAGAIAANLGLEKKYL